MLVFLFVLGQLVDYTNFVCEKDTPVLSLSKMNDCIWDDRIAFHLFCVKNKKSVMKNTKYSRNVWIKKCSFKIQCQNETLNYFYKMVGIEATFFLKRHIIIFMYTLYVWFYICIYYEGPQFSWFVNKFYSWYRITTQRIENVVRTRHFQKQLHTSRHL